MNANETRKEPSDSVKVEIEGVFKIYKTKSVEVVALRGLDLSIRKGEFISIMGPSGCGKSTLLNIVGGLDKPSAGRVVIDGKDISMFESDQLVEFRRTNVGFVFQFFNLVPTLTARENIELPMRLVNLPSDTMKKRSSKLLELVELEGRAHHRPDELSGGEQQRIAIAVALANDPSIVLADEPTGELDSESGEKVLELFRKLSQEESKTVIIVTHDPRTATLSNRSFRIEDGQITGEYSQELYSQDDEQAMDTMKYKKMVENIVDKRKRMEELLKEIIQIEDDIIMDRKG